MGVVKLAPLLFRLGEGGVCLACGEFFLAGVFLSSSFSESLFGFEGGGLREGGPMMAASFLCEYLRIRCFCCWFKLVCCSWW